MSFEKLFNRKFGFTNFEYSGEDLEIKDFSKGFKLHDYQNAAVRRLSEQGTGILAILTRKTSTALGLYAYKNKRAFQKLVLWCLKRC